jgi:predicted nucleotidyltransferase
VHSSASSPPELSSTRPRRRTARLEDMVTEDRFEQFVQLRGLLARWALRQGDIVAAAVVGSWARRSARMDSDLDVVVITTHPGQYVTIGGSLRPLGRMPASSEPKNGAF